MTKPEYEAVYDKYLRNLEGLDKPGVEKSPLSIIPKTLNRKAWIIASSIGLVTGMAISFLFSWIYEVKCLWYFNWISNAFLSLSLGVVASLLIMVYTNAKERNVAIYSDAIPLLEKRLEDMHKAFIDDYLKIDIHCRNQKYTECYQAWHASYHTCSDILDFLRYLHKVLPFHPKSLTFSLEEIEKATEHLTEADKKLSHEFFDQGSISRETVSYCDQVLECATYCLYNVEDLIQEFKCNLYGIKYGKVSKAVKNNDEDTYDV